MKPRWLRRNTACPSCGFMYRSEAELEEYTARAAHGFPTPIAVDCPRCKLHLTWGDFWDEQYEKWSVGGFSSRACIDS